MGKSSQTSEKAYRTVTTSQEPQNVVKETFLTDGNEEVNKNLTIQAPARRRKRDMVRQVSMRLFMKAQDIAEDVLRGSYLQRMEDAENVSRSSTSTLSHEIAPSKKTRKHLWQSTTQDDSVLIHGTKGPIPLSELAKKDIKEVQAFLASRVTDPTSYFYRFHFDEKRQVAPQRAEVQLVDISWLKPHEQVVSWQRVNGLKKATLNWDAYTEPLLVDIKTGAILDGHHRYNVGLQLCLKQLPAVLVDYLCDDTITVDVWAGCGRTHLTKQEVIDMSLSPNVFPPKTSRHRFTESLPPISIPLSILRQIPAPNVSLHESAGLHPNHPSQEEENEEFENIETIQLQRKGSFREASINLICGAQDLATSVIKGIFHNRLRKIEKNNHTKKQKTQLDIVKRPQPDSVTFFNVIRENDPSSAFCRQKAITLEDLLTSDANARRKFFLTRICDPTSYFYKYHYDAAPKRSPKKVRIKLASLKWLKAHEHVVSWDRVEGLRRATVRWGAYLEPLLVDINTGAILDGHHRYHVGLHLQLQSVPVVVVDYLNDDSITVDVWPNCGRDTLTKKEIIEMALSNDLFPPKTSRHKFSDDLPPISISLDKLRIPFEGNIAEV
jgi:hypothetical protein